MTHRLWLPALVAASLAVACDLDDRVLEDPIGPEGDAEIEDDVDNTVNNADDAEEGAKTPFGQSEHPADIRTTADIRKAILATDGLSTNADNVKIITADGTVTLRGVVETQAEKDTIASIAARVAAGQQIDNQLEVDAD